MKGFRIALLCILALIFVGIFSACSPPKAKNTDEKTKTFSQMSNDEIEEAAEAAFIALARKKCNRQDVYFDGYDIEDIGYRITDISIARTDKEAIIKGYMSFSNDYDEKRTYKFNCRVTFEEDGSYYAHGISLDYQGY